MRLAKVNSFLASKPEGRIVLFGAPFDSTSSYRPGSRFGPQAIREASHSLETFSPEQLLDLEECPFADDHDLELPFGDPCPALDLIEQKAARVISHGGLPFLLGGEHLVSLGAIRAASSMYPNLRVVHLDAHADLRDEYLGMRLSHATVMRRVLDLVGQDRLHQIGIRSCTREEHELSSRLSTTPEKVSLLAGENPCYLTCDIDILDPSVLPGTGTPEPGGLSFRELSHLLVSMITRLRVVGMDIVELSPGLDPSGVSTVVAAKLVRESLLALHRAPACG